MQADQRRSHCVKTSAGTALLVPPSFKHSMILNPEPITSEHLRRPQAALGPPGVVGALPWIAPLTSFKKARFRPTLLLPNNLLPMETPVMVLLKVVNLDRTHKYSSPLPLILLEPSCPRLCKMRSIFSLSRCHSACLFLRISIASVN